MPAVSTHTSIPAIFTELPSPPRGAAARQRAPYTLGPPRSTRHGASGPGVGPGSYAS